MESRKRVLMNLSAEQKWRGRHRELTCGHSGGSGGRGRMERALIYVQTVSGNLLHEAGSSNPEFCDNLEGRGIKRCLLLGRKAMTNLDSILKS